MTVLPFLIGMTVFAVADSVTAAIVTALIAGFFSIINTVINARIHQRVKKIEDRQGRVLEIVGERQSDKSIAPVGRNPNDPTNRERRG